jgi:hypothetical protein
LKLTAAVLIFALIEAGLAGQAFAADAERRPMVVDDLNQLRTVVDPTVSPDGEWVAYAVRTTDLVKDKRDWHVWMTRWDGKRSAQVTQSTESEHSPGWSPDGRYLSFLSGRAEKEGPDAFWLLDRRGGEARVEALTSGRLMPAQPAATARLVTRTLSTSRGRFSRPRGSSSSPRIRVAARVVQAASCRSRKAHCRLPRAASPRIGSGAAACFVRLMRLYNETTKRALP